MDVVEFLPEHRSRGNRSNIVVGLPEAIDRVFPPLRSTGEPQTSQERCLALLLDPVDPQTTHGALEITQKVREAPPSGKIQQKMEVVGHQDIGIQTEPVPAPVELQLTKEDLTQCQLSKKPDSLVGVSS